MQEFGELRKQHQDYYHNIESSKVAEERGLKAKDKITKEKAAQDRLNNVLNTVKSIEQNEIIQEEIKNSQVRKYICNTLTPIISEGLLRMVEVRPQNPVDYLVASSNLGRIPFWKKFWILINMQFLN